MSQANQRQADDIMKANIAGFFAGEGTICLKRCQLKKKYFCRPEVLVSLTNTEKVWIDLLKENFGGYAFFTVRKQTEYFPLWHWMARNLQAKPFLLAIRPFLIGEKKPSLEMGLEFLELMESAPIVKKYRKYSPELKADMERLVVKHAEYRRAVAETKRADAVPTRSDSPILEEIQEVIV